jgi:hypothetical protein
MVTLFPSPLEFQIFSVLTKGWRHSDEFAHDTVQHLLMTMDLDHIFNAGEISW